MKRSVKALVKVGALVVLLFICYYYGSLERGTEKSQVKVKKAADGSIKLPQKIDNVPSKEEPTTPIQLPTCPNHKTVGQATIPYGLIPDAASKKFEVKCQGNVKVFPIGAVVELNNVILDFGKRSFSGGGYSNYHEGFLQIPGCSSEELKSFAFNKILHSAVVGYSSSSSNYDEREGVASVVASRDDCGNVWHSLADFLTVFVASEIASLTPQEQKVLVLDDRLMVTESPDDIEICPYHGALNALGRKGVERGYTRVGKRVFYKKLIVPAQQGDEGYLTVIWSMRLCDSFTILRRYVHNIFDYFGLPSHKEQRSSIKAPLTIVLSSRRKKPFAAPGQQIGRVIENEDALAKALRQIPGVKTVIQQEFFELEYKAQVELVGRADILLGMHGAGLTNLIYLAPHAHVIEMVPFTWRSGEFQQLAGITNHEYRSWQNQNKTRHIEPSCRELERRNSASEPNVCRAGPSVTIVDVEEVRAVVEKSVTEILGKVNNNK